MPVRTWLTNFFNSSLWSNTCPEIQTGWFLSSGAGTPATQITQPVPECLTASGHHYALENARLLQPGWYPNGCVVQTGPNEDDWKVVVNSSLCLRTLAEARWWRKRKLLKRRPSFFPGGCAGRAG
jgi:hypothetical protein